MSFPVIQVGFEHDASHGYLEVWTSSKYAAAHVATVTVGQDPIPLIGDLDRLLANRR